jgi:hypothetical protein
MSASILGPDFMMFNYSIRKFVSNIDGGWKLRVWHTVGHQLGVRRYNPGIWP